jgi:hypothetical protein
MFLFTKLEPVLVSSWFQKYILHQLTQIKTVYIIKFYWYKLEFKKKISQEKPTVTHHTSTKTGKYRSSSKSTPSTKKKKTVNGVLQFLVVFNHKKNKKTFDLKTKTAQLNKFYEDVYNKS